MQLAGGVTAGGSPYGIGVKANCDEVEAEGSLEVMPWINAFAAVNHAPKSGQTTVVIGGRASVGGGPLEASFTSAAYVKVDAQGNIEDVGWRVGPSGGASTALVEYQADDLIDISFMPGPSHTPSG